MGKSFDDYIESLPVEMQDPLRTTTHRILERCNFHPDTRNDDEQAQLIVGEVQSGKTASFTGVAALARDARVYSFEPSVFNLELLARNIELNGLQKKICIIPTPLSNKLSFNMFQMSNTEWGGALSTFEHKINQDGELLKKVFEYQT